MKIPLEITKKKIIQVDIEFPFYARQWDIFDSSGAYDRAYRIEQSGNYTTIVKREDCGKVVSFELEIGRVDTKSYGGFLKEDCQEGDCKKIFFDLLHEVKCFQAKNFTVFP